MQITGFSDYRQYLRGVLVLRNQKNRFYSLRAFARDLQTSPQMLSAVLNGKKGLSQETAARFAERLEFSLDETNHFIDLVVLSDSRSELMQKLAQQRIGVRLSGVLRYQEVDLDTLHLISDWFHYAILELSETKNFNSQPKAIAQRLGITLLEATEAIARLKRLGLIKQSASGRIRKTHSAITTPSDVPSSALRKIAKHFLEKAAESLEAQSPQERDITTITMAVDPEKLPEAKRMIAAFRRKLCAFLEDGNRTEVYSFVPALFRLSLKEGSEK